jgi:Holliday junction resolvase RusA-like endonuclease
MKRWRGTILGEPASKANSRRVVRVGGMVRVIKSRKALDYVEGLERQIAALPVEDQLMAPIRMTAHVYYSTRRPDLDVSLILDALQGRIYRNDRAVRERHLYHHLDRDNPRAELELEEIDDECEQQKK